MSDRANLNFVQFIKYAPLTKGFTDFQTLDLESDMFQQANKPKIWEVF